MGSIPVNSIWPNTSIRNSTKRRKPMCRECNSMDVSLIDVTATHGHTFKGGTILHWSCNDCHLHFTGRSQEMDNELEQSFNMNGEQKCGEGVEDILNRRNDYNFQEDVKDIIFNQSYVDIDTHVSQSPTIVAMEASLANLHTKMENLEVEQRRIDEDLNYKLRNAVADFELKV